MICTHKYYRLIGSNKDKIARISRSMFRKQLEIKEVLSFYYTEIFVYTNLFLNTTISIPRHLLFADTFLIVIEFKNYSGTETLIYANGLVSKNNNRNNSIYLYDNKPLKTIFDITRNHLLNIVSKDTRFELEKIQNSRLYNSIIRKEYTRPRRRGPLSQADEFYLNLFLNQNNKYLTLCKDLDFEAFYNLYS